MTQQSLRTQAQEDDKYDVTNIEERVSRLEARLDEHIKLPEQVEALKRSLVGDPNAVNPNGLIATVRSLTDSVGELKRIVEDERKAREQRSALAKWVFGTSLGSTVAALAAIVAVAGGVVAIANLLGFTTR